VAMALTGGPRANQMRLTWPHRRTGVSHVSWGGARSIQNRPAPPAAKGSVPVIEIPAAAERAPSATKACSVDPAHPVAVLHLGRNGGGPKFTYALAEAIRALGQPVVSVVSRDATVQ